MSIFQAFSKDDQSAGSAISILKRMDAFITGMKFGQNRQINLLFAIPV